MKLTPFLLTLILSLLIVSLFLNNLLFNITHPLDVRYLDSYHVMFLIKHFANTFPSGQLLDLLSPPIFYGIKFPALFSELFLIPVLIGWFFLMITKDLTASYNLLAFGTILFSFISMSALGWYFTKNLTASLISAIIFVLNPMVFGHFPDRIQLYFLGFIPLIFLTIEKFLVRGYKKYLIGCLILLTLQLLTCSYYFAFLTILLPIYFFIRLKQQKIALIKLVSWWIFLGAGVFITILFGYLWLYQQVTTQLTPESTWQQINSYSAWISDLFLTTSNNLIYGDLRKVIYDRLPFLISPGLEFEHSFFWGLTPLVIFIISFFTLVKSKARKIYFLFLAMLGLSLLLSFGPQIHLTKDFKIPGPFNLLYLIDPVFKYLRVISRFNIMTFFFLGLIVSLTYGQISLKLSANKGKILAVVIAIMILVEYWNKPIIFSQNKLTPDDFYLFLDAQKQIKVILDLPIGNRLPPGVKFSRSEGADAIYLIPATFYHSKKLFNGFGSFYPKEYQKKAAMLSIGFPDPVKLEMLKSWGVDGIIVHRQEYPTDREFNLVVKKLEGIGVPVIGQNQELVLFDLTKWSLKKII